VATAPSTKIAIDGTISDEAEARISVLDRGFLYGDSVYEVIRTYDGRPFALDEHLDRLERSADLLGIELPVPRQALAREIHETLAAAANPEAYIRVIVTRGSGPINLDPGLAVSPCRVVIVAPLAGIPGHLYEEGAAIHLVAGGRHPGGAVPLGAKSGNYLVNLMALGAARRRGAHEAILLDASGRVAEGASSNIFALRDQQLHTPHLSVGILEGITRHKVIELARAAGLEVLEHDLWPGDLRTADEIFLTSTLREILPVTRVDDWIVGEGVVGPVVRRLRAMYGQQVRRGGSPGEDAP
jgi:branched-chain amino acid aminotransferase